MIGILCDLWRRYAKEKHCEVTIGNLLRIDRKVSRVNGKLCFWVGRYLQLVAVICGECDERRLAPKTVAKNVGYRNECGDSKLGLAFFATCNCVITSCQNGGVGTVHLLIMWMTIPEASIEAVEWDGMMDLAPQVVNKTMIMMSSF